jgi:hypothetical protein
MHKAGLFLQLVSRIRRFHLLQFPSSDMLAISRVSPLRMIGTALKAQLLQTGQQFLTKN